MNESRRHLRTAPLLAATLLVISVAPLIILGWLTLPNADDFTHSLDVRLYPNPFALALERYDTWSGRLLTEFLIGVVFRGYAAFSIVGVFNGLSLAIVGGALVAIPLAYCGCLRMVWTPTAAALIALGIAAIWLTGFQMLGEAVFWATGGLNYVVPLALALLWLLAFADGTRARRRPRPWVIPLWVVASVVIGTGHEELSAALLAVAGSAIGAEIFFRRLPPRALFFAIVGLVGVAIGTLLLYGAPGNFIRAQQEGFPIALSASKFEAAVPYVVNRFWSLASPIAIVAPLCGLIAFLIYRAQPYRLPEDRLLEWSVLLTLGGVASLVPLLVVPDITPARAFLTPAALLTGGIAQLTFALLNMFVPEWSLLSRPAALIGVAGLLVVMFVYERGAFTAVRGSAVARGQLDQRYAMLDTLAGTDVTVDPLTAPVPPPLFFSDVTADRTYWINSGVAQFFGLKSIGRGS